MENMEKIPVRGLSDAEAAVRLKKYGENTVWKKKKTGPWLVIWDKIRNPLIILMIAISTLSFFLGSTSSAVIVLLMVALAVTLDFLNTYRSQKTVDSLAARVITKVTVVRSGSKKDIESRLIVPGDVVFLSAGNVIPADCELLSSDDFFVNQSSLTGESMPVEKSPSLKNSQSELSADKEYAIFMGTSVVSGFAYARAIRTGAETEFGKVAIALGSKEPKTDFEINMMRFGIFVMKVVFCMVSFVFFLYLIRHVDRLDKYIIIEAFTFALAITIGVTPDMLPAIMTICLSKGSQMMAKKDVIVKHLASIENFGSMDILATDKTGTLTMDHIVLVRFVDYQDHVSRKVLELGYLSSHFHTGVANPLDQAISEFENIDVAGYAKIDEIPYDFHRKRSSMVVEKDGKRLLVSKGAPEEVLSICGSFELAGRVSSDQRQIELIKARFAELSRDGFRVLAVAWKEIPNDEVKVYSKDIETNLVFSGFLAFLDPPKDDVKKTLDEIGRLGIEVKILTGDNELLAQKICRDIGLEASATLTGQEIDCLNEAELKVAALKTSIFARINPEQKERIILALKQAGKAVGYLGDGINDAPALKAADVGISVDNAVDIAKDTADIILMRKSLDILKDGIIEGRKTFHNTLKYILMGLSSNFGNMFSMTGAAAFLPFLPMLPGQILFNNFVYDTSQFSLPADNVDDEDLLKPAHWDLKFIRKYMIVFGLVSSVFDFLIFYLLFFVYHLSEHRFQTGWLLASIATQTLVVHIIRTKKIPFIQSRPSKSLLGATLSAVAFVWILPFTPFGKYLFLERLQMEILAVIISLVLAYLGLVEVVKRFFYHHHDLKRHPNPRAF